MFPVALLITPIAACISHGNENQTPRRAPVFIQEKQVGQTEAIQHIRSERFSALAEHLQK
jgi:hypothetical protein